MFSIHVFLTCQSKLPMTYKHHSQAERYQIHALMKAEHDQSEIAKVLDRNKSTRKLPHQVDNSKLEIPVLNVLGMNSMGVLSPRESWGLNSL